MLYPTELRAHTLIFKLFVPGFFPELEVSLVVLPYYLLPVTLNIFRQIRPSSLLLLRSLHLFVGL